ncbi:MAG: hypothetical protein K0Q49_950 [Haloplasmataceae bacterium]|nr:hypothetical protein [Haloplasmataceae bacterium]
MLTFICGGKYEYYSFFIDSFFGDIFNLNSNHFTINHRFLTMYYKTRKVYFTEQELSKDHHSMKTFKRQNLWDILFLLIIFVLYSFVGLILFFIIEIWFIGLMILVLLLTILYNVLNLIYYNIDFETNDIKFAFLIKNKIVYYNDINKIKVSKLSFFGEDAYLLNIRYKKYKKIRLYLNNSQTFEILALLKAYTNINKFTK